MAQTILQASLTHFYWMTKIYYSGKHPISATIPQGNSYDE